MCSFESQGRFCPLQILPGTSLEVSPATNSTPSPVESQNLASSTKQVFPKDHPQETATSRQPLAIPSGGKSFALVPPGYLISKHRIPFPHAFHSVSVWIELSLEAPFYINASQMWRSEAPARLPPAPALGGPGTSSSASSGSCPAGPSSRRLISGSTYSRKCPPLSALRGRQALFQPGPHEPLWVF